MTNFAGGVNISGEKCCWNFISRIGKKRTHKSQKLKAAKYSVTLTFMVLEKSWKLLCLQLIHHVYFPSPVL